MNRKRILAVVLVLCVIVTGATRSQAFSLVVFDPSNFTQAVEQVLRLEQQYRQLVRTYWMVQNQYEQLVWNARRVPVNMAARYRALSTPWKNGSAGNTYGTTSAWVNAINSGFAVANGYIENTERLVTYGPYLSKVPAAHQAFVKTSYGTVELTDGATQGAMEVIGRVRANAPEVGRAISALEDDSLSSAPEMNTEVGVLNKISAANIIAVRTAQDTNKLLVALAEQQAIESKRIRDAEARAIAQHVQFVAEGRETLRAQAAGASAAQRAWRMP